MDSRAIGAPFRGAAFDPTPLLFLLAVAAACTWIIGESPLAAAGILAAVVVPSAIYWFSRSTVATIAALAIGMVTSHYSLELAGVHLRPEHVAVLLAVCAMALRFARGEVFDVRELWLWLDGALIAYLALNFFSSAFFSPAPAQTLKWATQQSLAVAPYFIIRLLAGRTAAEFRSAVRIVLLVFSLEAVFALLCLLSSLVFHTELGMTPGMYGENLEFPGTQGSQFEPNLLGSTSGAAFLIMLAMYLHRREKKLLPGLAITWAAVLFALSRAAAGAVAFVLTLLVIVMFRKKWIGKGNLLRAAGVMLVATLALAPLVVPMWTSRFGENATDELTEDPNTRFRLLTLAAATDDIASHPIVGNGTSSFQVNFDYSDIGIEQQDAPDIGGWLSNVEVRVLHDTGVVGLATLGVFLVGLTVACWRMMKQRPSGELLGLMAASFLYAITFQTTEATMLAFCWVHVGLLASALVVLRRENAVVGGD